MGDHFISWMQPRCHQWHLIDYVIVHKKDLQNVCSMRGADNWIDHALMRANLNFVLKPVAKRGSNTRKLPKRLDVAKLHSPENRILLKQRLSKMTHIYSHLRKK